MRTTSLPAPGPLTQGYLLRVTCAQAISGLEIAARRTPGGKVRGAATLSTFFAAAKAACDTIADATAPTMAGTTATRVSATSITVVFTGETMDQTVTPGAAAFTIPSRTVTGVAWTNATTLTLTGTGFTAGDVLTYTKPVSNFLRDAAGNAVATGTKTLV